MPEAKQSTDRYIDRFLRPSPARLHGCSAGVARTGLIYSLGLDLPDSILSLVVNL